MATKVVDANLRSDAAAILQRFETLQNEFQNKSPQEFKRDMGSIATDVTQLTQLRTRFNSACQDRETVPGVSQDELLKVYQQWDGANKILSSLEESRLVADGYEDLSNSTTEQEKNFDPVTVGQLIHKTRSVFYQSATSGVKEAYNTLNQRLTTLLQAKMPVPAPAPQRPNTPDLRARHDEESYLADLWGAWNVSEKNFTHALQLYQNASAYLAGKKGPNQFVSEIARNGFSEFTKRMTDTLSSAIGDQKALEEATQRKCEAYDFNTTNFGRIKTAIFSSEPSQFKFNAALSEAYKALPQNLKGTLRDAVAAEAGVNLSDKKYVDDKQFTLVNWPGTLDQKKAALHKLIPDTPPVPVPNLSIKMEAEMKVAGSGHSSQIVPPPASVAPAAVVPPQQTATFHQAIDDLKRVIVQFETGKSADAQFGMAQLATKGLTLYGTNAADRVNFHMFLIHRAAGKPINDPDYGANAFQGKIPADDSERILAIRRTMIESALEGLTQAYSSNLSAAETTAYLDLLETKQELIDAAGGNLAHKLFGAVYQIYSEARALNPSLHDPNDGSMFGDFGRSVMNNTASIDAQFKLNAVRKIHDELKTAWNF